MKNLTLILFISGIILGSCNKSLETEASCSTSAAAAQSSNPEIVAMKDAMIAFRKSLSPILLKKGTSCLDNQRVVQWSNLPPQISPRNGIAYGELTPDQLTKFQEVLKLFLSADGYQKVDEITMLAEAYLNVLNSNQWSSNYYSIDLFENPETSGSWGFQLDGHHCAINFLVHGDKVSLVPAFLGAEPVKATFHGINFDIFKDERDLALSLYNGFTPAENSAAVSSGSAATMVVGPAENSSVPDPFAGSYDYSQFKVGLKYSDMSTATQEKLVLLMREYVYNLKTSFADVWWADVMNNIDETYFVWLDNVDAPSATTQFYYRIYNPYLWAEYNMEPPVGQGIESWNHAHTITRIPNSPATNNGGDYGIFAKVVNKGGPRTLYEHYIAANHHEQSEFPFDYKVEAKPDKRKRKVESHHHEHGHHHHHYH